MKHAMHLGHHHYYSRRRLKSMQNNRTIVEVCCPTFICLATTITPKQVPAQSDVVQAAGVTSRSQNCRVRGQT